MPSAAISRVEYEETTQTLSLWFRPSGELYRYFEVPPRVHEAFRNSRSKGRFFNLYIRNQYPFQRIGDPSDGRHAA